MNVFVSGLWHLGSVISSCISEHHDTTGFDPDQATVDNLSRGIPPIFEPGLEAEVQRGLAAGTLHFVPDLEVASNADVVWIAYDTPVDEQDRADVAYVDAQAAALFPYLTDGTLVLVSSQMPVGSIARLERAFAASSERQVSFGYTPENLRLGQALSIFKHPDRIIVGVRTASDREVVSNLFEGISNNIVWMSPESAEMTKHAINGFLAVSVTFMNEVAAICERVGADSKDVEAGLRSESRIGPKAYVSPGTGFGGGTLARDIQFLSEIGKTNGTAVDVLEGVLASNDKHKTWAERRLHDALGELSGKEIALLGLTYKPGTDTLRRSSAVELAESLAALGAVVKAFDPAIHELPVELRATIHLRASARAALASVDAVVVTTEWPEFKDLTAADFTETMRTAIVLDPKRSLGEPLMTDDRIRYIAIGRGT